MEKESQKYLIIEIQSLSIRVLEVERNVSSKKILIGDISSFQSSGKLDGRKYRDKFVDFKKYIAGYPLSRIDKVIVSLSAEFANTDFVNQKFKRRQTELALNESELESLITNLANSNLPADQFYIYNFVVDGYHTTNPAGTNGGEINIHFSRTQIEKKFFSELKNILPSEKITLIGSAGPLYTHTFSHIFPARRRFILASITYDTTTIYTFENGFIKYYRQIRWGEKNLLSVLFGQLAVNQSAAREILNIYCQGKLSPHLSKKIDSFFSNEFDNLNQQLDDILNRENITHAYILPFFIFPKEQLKSGRGKKNVLVDNYFVVEKLGFELKLKKSEKIVGADLLSVPLLVLESDLIFNNSFANKSINRRLRWINGE